MGNKEVWGLRIDFCRSWMDDFLADTYDLVAKATISQTDMDALIADTDMQEIFRMCVIGDLIEVERLFALKATNLTWLTNSRKLSYLVDLQSNKVKLV